LAVPFSPDYVRLVLNENFEDAKTLWLSPLMAVHAAHLTMLAEQGIIPIAEARRIRDALEAIDQAHLRTVAYDGSYEDLFFYVDRLVVAACGADTAGRLHTARSRNDIDMTMYRMRVREWVLTLAEATLDLREALLGQAADHRRSLFPAHTHAQPAQPTTVAHYLMAVVEQLERDTTRLLAAYATVNRCPLGACAITGTGFPIARQRTSDLLGFDAPTGNTYGSIAAVDYLLESASAAGVLLVGIGRFVQDMLLWCTSEMGYLRLPDGFVQTSSIMPQKRNPVALEHARALASKALAETSALGHAVHNTPFGDIVDNEDDLQPLVASAFRDATRATALVAATMAGATFVVGRMRARTAEGWVTITELADTLVRESGMPFQTAHAVASLVVRTCPDTTPAHVGGIVRRAASEAGHPVSLSDADIERALSPDHFVEARRTPGGPSPTVVSLAIDESRASLQRDRVHLSERRARLSSSVDALDRAVSAL
jgi:argininosuccinate lyase